jgi:CubicO group peptidase (beta-lactamase class C family)
VSLSGSATDDGLPTGSALSYAWTIVSGPQGAGAGVTFSAPTAAATSARFVGGPGDYLLQLAASDGALTGTSQIHVTVNHNPNIYPAATSAAGGGWISVTPDAEQMSVTLLDQARDYSLTAGVGNTSNGSGYIIRHGHLVYSWGSSTAPYELKSTTKSAGGLALLLALDEGKLALTDSAASKLPILGTDPPVDTSNVAGGGSLSDITVLQLATHTSGLSKSDAATPTPRALLYKPGSTWSYSDQGLNTLADVLTQTYAQDLNALMFSRIYTTLGIGTTDLQWRDNFYRTPTITVNGAQVKRRELGSGITANVEAMARIGLLMLRRGVWGDQLLLSNAIVDKVHVPPAEVASATIADPTNYPGAVTNYGILWWTNTTGQMTTVPKDAYWAWGLYESFIIVIPSLDLVVVRLPNATAGWHTDSASTWNADYSLLEKFIGPIAQSVSH